MQASVRKYMRAHFRLLQKIFRQIMSVSEVSSSTATEIE